MERPDLEEAERLIVLHDSYGPAGKESTPLFRSLIEYIRYLESSQPEDGEPYIIKAGEFNDERHEIPICINRLTRVIKWGSSDELEYDDDNNPIGMVPEWPIVVRDKPIQIGRTDKRMDHDT